jgi:hypothetical protein
LTFVLCHAFTSHPLKKRRERRRVEKEKEEVEDGGCKVRD